MSRIVGIGVVGVGWMGRLHTVAYRRCRDHFPECAGIARLVVAADEDGERARGAVDLLGYERCVEDWRSVIADPAVEAISIAAPNRLHREVALAAAQLRESTSGSRSRSDAFRPRPRRSRPRSSGRGSARSSASTIATRLPFDTRGS